MMNQEGRYIYCLINSPEKLRFKAPGMEQAPVYTVNYQALAAVISPSPIIKYDISRENLIAHQLVMEEALANFTVLPVRFGTIAEDSEQIENRIAEKVLKARYSEFQKLMKKLSDKMELGLKIFWTDMNPVFARILENNPELRKLKSRIEKQQAAGQLLQTRNNMIELGERVKETLENIREAEKNKFLAHLKKLAFDLKDHPPAFDKMILNTAFLIEKKKEPEFSGEIDRLRAENDGKIIFKYVGPVPPCNFIELTISW